MEKKKVLWTILDLIFLVIFNTMFFIGGGFDRKPSVWISYGFIHFAYFMLLLSPLLIRRGKSSHIFGFSVYGVSSSYFSLELLVGVVFILLALDSYRATLLVQLAIAGVYGIILVANLLANEATAEAEEVRQIQIAYVKDASVKLKGLLDSVSDKDVKRRLEKVYDAVYSSPVKSHPSLAQLEGDILNSINELENAVSQENNNSIGSLADLLLKMVNERNIRQKSLN